MTRQEHIDHCNELLSVIPAYADKLAWLKSLTDREYDRIMSSAEAAEHKMRAKYGNRAPL